VAEYARTLNAVTDERAEVTDSLQEVDELVALLHLPLLLEVQLVSNTQLQLLDSSPQLASNALSSLPNVFNYSTWGKLVDSVDST